MSDVEPTPSAPAIDTDPPQKPKQSGKGTMIALVVILVLAWVTFGFMRKPGAASKLLGLSEDHQRLFVLADGQGSSGLGSTFEITEEMKAAQNAEPIPMGKKGVWYTFYPPMEEEDEIKKEVTGGNGWTVVSKGEEHYTWKGKYDIKLRAPASNPKAGIGGVMFFEHEQGIGDMVGTTLKNMLP
jgi:hypothetical protein